MLTVWDVQSMVVAINNLWRETHAGFAEVIAPLDALLQEPETEVD